MSRENFVPGGKYPGRILSREANVPGGFCTERILCDYYYDCQLIIQLIKTVGKPYHLLIAML